MSLELIGGINSNVHFQRCHTNKLIRDIISQRVVKRVARQTKADRGSIHRVWGMKPTSGWSQRYTGKISSSRMP